MPRRRALTGALSLLPEIELANVNAALRPTRWVKHAEEVAVMSELADLSAAVMPYYREELRPGRSVQQADAAIAARLHAEAERRFAGANFSIVKATTVAGAASASPHGDGVSCGRQGGSRQRRGQHGGDALERPGDGDGAHLADRPAGRAPACPAQIAP